MSDIHGFYTPLKEALDAAGFDPKNKQHLLICCGDYFDRGEENLKVLKYLDLLENKVLLRGNHEDMLIKILDTGRLEPHNYLNGTPQTIAEFFGKYALDEFSNIDFSGKTRMLDRVTEFISQTVNYYETENFVFVHGWLPAITFSKTNQTDPNWRVATEDKWQKARWTKWTDIYNNSRPLPDKTLVCGHVPSFYAHRFDSNRQKDCADIFYGNGLNVLDAGTYTTGKINVFITEDNLL